jgi:L-lactate dehydrogenase complex protein LldE
MVREQYPILLEDAPDWEVGGWKTAGRTYEFVEFLTTVLKVDLSHLMLPTTTAITCHLPCQMRSLGSPDQTPRIVRNMRNVEFRQLDDTDRCCGAGAGLPMKQPEIARTMAAEKVAAITATGAQVTVCNEPLCTIQITAAGRRTEWSGSTKHIAELLAEAMEIDLENR